jgi:hypothetical protein
MNVDFSKQTSSTTHVGRIEDRRRSPRMPLMLTAWVWRAEEAQEPIAIRLMDHSEQGVGFISPIPLEVGEVFEFSLEREGQRRSGLTVTNCEFFNENAFRVGARAQ